MEHVLPTEISTRGSRLSACFLVVRGLRRALFRTNDVLVEGLMLNDLIAFEQRNGEMATGRHDDAPVNAQRKALSG